MTRLAKASSTFIFGRSASAGAGHDARSSATRGASSGDNGSGAPSHARKRTALVLAISAFVLLAFAPAAFAVKSVDRFYGFTSGALGGQFNSPRDVAVNEGGTGGAAAGDVYVVNSTNNRIEVLSAAGAFKFAFGRDVIGEGKAGDLGEVFEKCTVAANCKAGTVGTLGGEFSNPQGIAINQSTGDVYVRDIGNRRIQQFSATGAFIRAWGWDVVQTGGTGDDSVAPINEFEICTVASQCQAGVTGTGKGQFATSGTNSTGIAISPVDSDVYVVDPGNRRAERFNSNGTVDDVNEVQRVAVDAEGGTYTLTYNGQTTAPIDYNAAANGVATSVQTRLEDLSNLAPGDVTVTGGPGGPGAVNPYTITFGGTLAAANVVQITSNPALLTGGASTAVATTLTEGRSALIGSSSNFGSSQPLHVAVDSAGIAYFSDSNGSGEIDRYNTNTSVLMTSIASGALTAGSTSGLEVDPDSDGGGADVDRLYVLRDPTSGNTVVQQFDSPGGAVAPSSPTAVHATTEFGTSAMNGLGVNVATDKLYVSAGTGTACGAACHGVFVLDNDGTSATAGATLNGTTEVGTSTATLNGTLTTPEGLLGYHFEYSKNGTTWITFPEQFPSVVGSQNVTQNLTELEANTLYRVRLVMRKVLGTSTTTTSTTPEGVFATDAAPPTAETLPPAARSDSSAKLAARINANGSLTNYRFQWGLTTGYGDQVPIPAGNAGQSGAPVFVSEEISNLEPNTTYHYRVIAQSSEGTATGEDIAFTTRSGLSVPQRAYEMVTPPFKTIRTTTAFAASDGNATNPGVPSIDGNSIAWTTVIFPLTDDVNAPSNGDKRIIDRTSDGWVWHTLNTLPMVTRSGFENTEYNPVFAKQNVGASTADLKTLTWTLTGLTELIPSTGPDPNLTYTRRDETGVKGFTLWTTDSRQTFTINGEYSDKSGLNDEGTAMIRWGTFRGVAEDPNVAGDEDPSNDQQAEGVGSSVYRQKAETPAGLPGAPKELVNECTGTGVSATLLPMRVGTGASTDTIGTQACEEQTATPLVTGTGVRTNGSSTLTSVATSTGSFAVGQFISGPGIPSGTKITAVGAGTLTMSTSALCGAAQARARSATAGSPILHRVITLCGQLEVGQTVTGSGIPGGATIVAISGPGGNTVTLSGSATITGEINPITVVAPTTTALRAENQHITSTGGARAGGLARIGAMSNDGNRLFFTSPEPAGSAYGPTSCSTAVAGNTACPPQLFVRQYDSNENPTVRWVSRSQGIGAQQVSEMGTTVFQGASKDGRYVYFQTNSPLVPSDPNGGNSITSGNASSNSWDLYRYTLPASLDSDPAGGVLQRISGGPSGSADPGGNDVNGASLRYLSDDGKRAYFVTAAPITGAENNPPSGGVTTPGGAIGNTTTRDLYLFDDTGVTPRWRFVAQIPYSTSSSQTDSSALNSCASSASELGTGQFFAAEFHGRAQGRNNCFRGTPDGTDVVFFTAARLTADDTDNAGDIYLYKSQTNELIRVSAGLPGASPYGCNRPTDNGSVIQPASGVCNADLGLRSAGGGLFGNSAGLLDSARGWGGGRYYNMAVDADGVVSVFFESQSRLIAADTNGEHMDVYQWRNGNLSLVSPGDTPNDSFYSGNGVDGRDVFMFTSDRIDPREIDDSDYDLYDARVGGGFPYTPPVTPCDVLAEDCRNPASTAPVAKLAATVASQGSGNVTAPPKCKKDQRLKNGRCVKKKSKAKKAHKSKRRSAASHEGGAK